MGDTIYNVMKINDFEVDEEGRPLNPVQILSAEIIWNPFEDIVPRSTLLSKRSVRDIEAKKESDRKKARIAKKSVFCLDWKGSLC